MDTTTNSSPVEIEEPTHVIVNGPNNKTEVITVNNENGSLPSITLSIHRTAISRLSFLDKYLFIWIFLCMTLGVLLGVYVPSIQAILNSAQFVGVSLPIAIGLVVMMYPVLAKVQYEKLPTLTSLPTFRHHLGLSLILNWLIAPTLMAALAWMTLPDLPNYRAGLMLVGAARCIAMVLIWNRLAGGDTELCAFLVAFNSIMQVLLYGPFAYFWVVIVGQGPTVGINMWVVCKSVLVFLGIPLLGGACTRGLFRFSLRRVYGEEKWRQKQAFWYDQKFLPVIEPFALLGLLYTIIILFALQGNAIIYNIGPVFRVAIPLLLYFGILFILTFYICYKLHVELPVAITQSFTAASNNFELALAVAIATYGPTSQVALAATIGPLVEVPVLVGLVYVSNAFGLYYIRNIPRKEDVEIQEKYENVAIVPCG